jgi:hypothetical protein
MTTSPARTEHAAPHRRSALAVAAAVLLVLLALVVLMADAGEGGLGFGTAVFCTLLGLAAVGLVWGGRPGYWFGVVVAAILAVLSVVGVAVRGMDGGDVIVVAIGVAPLALLLPPAARRSSRSRPAGEPGPDASPVQAADGADQALIGGTASGDTWPQEWTRPLARGWVTFALILLGGAALTAFGVVVLLSDRSDPWLASTSMLFGLGCLAGSSLLRPRGRRARTHLRLEMVDLGHTRERGTAFPYSRVRTAATFFLGGAFALAMVTFALGEEYSGEPGGSSRWLGVFGALLLFALVCLGARKGLGRRWRVVLTPSAVVFAQGRSLTVVPWEAIDEVKAFEVTTYARGFAIREPYIGLVAGDSEAIRTGRFERALMGLNRAFGADISLPIRPLATDPVLLYASLRRYHRDSRARSELGTGAALDGGDQSLLVE